MSITIQAHFDGKVIVPDEPVQLSPGQSLRLSIEQLEPAQGPFADLVQFAADLPDLPTDLAAGHDHYALTSDHHFAQAGFRPVLAEA